LLRMFPCRSGRRRTMPLADLMNLRFCRHVHTSRYARFSSSFCPAPARHRRCHPYAVCGSPSRSGKGPHPAGPLTGNRHPPSWRAEPGSDPRPDGQRFRTGDTAAGVRSIWPVNTRASRPGPAIPRSMGRDGAGASTIQSHRVQAFFTLTVRITFRALETSSSCSTLTSLRYAIPLPHPDSWFPQDPADVSRGEGVR
jgi:hypothetical protein